MGIHHHDWPHAVASEHACALAELRALRQSIADRIEADIALLDALDGDPDLDADYSTVEADPSGRLHFLGRSSDDELDAETECENEHGSDADREDWRQPLHSFGSGCTSK